MNFSAPEVLEVDVAVIGAGGAGLRAALEAGLAGARTLLVTKGRIAVSGATAVGLASTAGFAVPDGAGDPLDSPDVHFQDIMTAAQGCADAALVRVLVDEALSAYEDLRRWEVEFVQDSASGQPLVAQGDFASRPRNRKIYHHGKPITVALKREIGKAGVQALERTMVLALLQDDAGVRGFLALTLDGRLVEVRCKATVITTGGAGQLFTYSLMPPDITGDGYALGYESGAPLVNMEFMQAGFGTIKPALNIIMAYFWGLLPDFLDKDGRPVLDGQLPAATSASQVMAAKVKHYPFSTSDDSKWLEIVAKQAEAAGRAGARGEFFLDLRQVDDRRLQAKGFAQLWRVSKEWLLKKRMDVTQEPLRIGLFGHAINGGMVIDAHGQTAVPGLLAAGESAGGPYGADRLGGNMLLNCQVFGKRAGIRAAEVAQAARAAAAGPALGRAALRRLEHRTDSQAHRALKEAHTAIKETMTRHVLVIRDEPGLLQAERELRAVQETLEGRQFAITSCKDVFRLYEALSLAQVGLMMVRAARLRKESRGSHFRGDAPALDPDWAVPILVSRGEDGPVCTPGRFAGESR